MGTATGPSEVVGIPLGMLSDGCTGRAVAVGVEVRVGRMVGVEVGVEVGVLVGSGVGSGLWVDVGFGVLVGIGVRVGLLVGVGVTVIFGPVGRKKMGVGVSVGIGVRVGFLVGVGVGVILMSGHRSSTGNCPMRRDGVGVSPKLPTGMETDIPVGFTTTSGMETRKLPDGAAGPNV